MDYEEFYRIIEEKRKDIDTLDAGEEEKNYLYSLLDENVQYFEESKAHMKVNSKLSGAFDKIGKGLQELISASIIIKKELPKLEKIALQLRINKTGRGQTPLSN